MATAYFYLLRPNFQNRFWFLSHSTSKSPRQCFWLNLWNISRIFPGLTASPAILEWGPLFGHRPPVWSSCPGPGPLSVCFLPSRQSVPFRAWVRSILPQVPKCFIIWVDGAEIPVRLSSFIIVLKDIFNIHGGCQYHSFSFDSQVVIKMLIKDIKDYTLLSD